MSGFFSICTGDTFSFSLIERCLDSGQTGQTGRSKAKQWTKAKPLRTQGKHSIVYCFSSVALAVLAPLATAQVERKSLLSCVPDMGHGFGRPTFPYSVHAKPGSTGWRATDTMTQ